MKNHLTRAWVLGALLCGTLVSNAAPTNHPAGFSAMDKQFVTDAIEGSLGEIQYAKVVLKKAASPSVRQFAQTMIQDHSKAIEDMKPLARQMKISIPSEPSDTEKVVISRIAEENGTQLEAAYKAEMIRDHTEDIGNAQRELSLGQNSQVKSAAQKGLMMFQMHLKKAQSMRPSA